MKPNFNEVINRKGTFCTQWDYIEDRFGEKDLLPFSISDTDFRIPERYNTRLKNDYNMVFLATHAGTTILLKNRSAAGTTNVFPVL